MFCETLVLVKKESTREIPFVNQERIIEEFSDVTNFNGYTYSREDIEQVCNEMIQKRLTKRMGLELWLSYNSELDQS